MQDGGAEREGDVSEPAVLWQWRDSTVGQRSTKGSLELRSLLVLALIFRQLAAIESALHTNL
jgi:hypothetical protein